ncbi:MAG TPA: filamentous hemagglutinin N-terminal domain-containing protein [Nostocaceae cyanobacterium]|nr:filamentous hemagglutinin N-terminal domain-containing protein [Nostocaceae cyanobacterium]
MNNYWVGFSGLGITLSGIIAALSINPVLANVIPDNTLPNNSQVRIEVNSINIDGGTRLSGSNNLFHSFQEFSVPQGFTAHFRNPEDVQNIIARVTGNSVSNIEGVLKANGAANLFLINPHGIIFGSNAALDIGGSFIASTASSINFQNGTKFSATDPQFTPLLAVSVPIGLQFGTNVATIVNQSQAVSLVNPIMNNSDNSINFANDESVFPIDDRVSTTPITNIDNNTGLRVNSGKTIALVGGDITLDGGIVTANSGRIELGSVGSNSLVSLNPEDGWSLGYKNTQIFQDIRFIKRGHDLSVLDTSSSLDNLSASGSIHIRGNLVELSGNSTLRSLNISGEKGGNIEIYARRLHAKEGAQIITNTFSGGASGNLTVNASESVELIGNNQSLTRFSTATQNIGSAGDISIETPTLRIKDGASISAGSEASENLPASLAESSGGNITVKADIVEIAGFQSELSASTTSYGNAGKIDITTQKLIVRDQGKISVVSFLSQAVDLTIISPEQNQIETPGELNVNAQSIVLANKAQLTATSGIGQGGSVTLNVQDLLLMGGGSRITANAAEGGSEGNGRNITINAPNGFVVATPLENNDITANALSGSGGQITINAQGIFGLVPRTGAELVRLFGNQIPRASDSPTSDITAYSVQNPVLNGIIEINTPNVDPSRGLSKLTEKIVDASGQIDRGCGVSGSRARSTFTFTGRGGFASNPLEPLTSEGVLTNWVVLEDGGQNLADGVQKVAKIPQPIVVAKAKQESNFVNNPEPIVEAQSWVVDANGKVVLIAQTPDVKPHSPGFTSASCLRFLSGS